MTKQNKSEKKTIQQCYVYIIPVYVFDINIGRYIVY